jgi:hypothetical protein
MQVVKQKLNFLNFSKGCGEKLGMGDGGEMTQTMYAHVNK